MRHKTEYEYLSKQIAATQSLMEAALAEVKEYTQDTGDALTESERVDYRHYKQQADFWFFACRRRLGELRHRMARLQLLEEAYSKVHVERTQLDVYGDYQVDIFEAAAPEGFYWFDGENGLATLCEQYQAGDPDSEQKALADLGSRMGLARLHAGSV